MSSHVVSSCGCHPIVIFDNLGQHYTETTHLDYEEILTLKGLTLFIQVICSCYQSFHSLYPIKLAQQLVLHNVPHSYYPKELSSMLFR
jgi:hypothetical protein